MRGLINRLGIAGAERDLIGPLEVHSEEILIPRRGRRGQCAANDNHYGKYANGFHDFTSLSAADDMAIRTLNIATATYVFVVFLFKFHLTEKEEIRVIAG